MENKRLNEDKNQLAHNWLNRLMKGSLWSHDSQPNFVHCHPHSRGGKEQKANARLSANKKM
ncbi:MAG: hypothetical protein WD431_12430, partial [Cyclobacteriaceae bacterium]